MGCRGLCTYSTVNSNDIHLHLYNQKDAGTATRHSKSTTFITTVVKADVAQQQ